MVRWISAICLVAWQSIALAADPKVGDRVFWKDDAMPSNFAEGVDPSTILFPSVVRDVQGDQVNLGWTWMNKSNTLTADEAIDYYSHRIEQNSKVADVWHARARVWQEKGDHKKAVADLLDAAKLERDNPARFSEIGQALQIKGDHAASIKYFNEAIRLSPKLPGAYYNRGRAYQYLGKYAEAANDFAQSIQVDPTYLPGYNNAAWLAATCPDERFRDGKKAVGLATKAAELSKNSLWEILDTLAVAQAEAGDFAAAVKTAEKAIALGGNAAVEAGTHQRLELFKAGKPYHDPPL